MRSACGEVVSSLHASALGCGNERKEADASGVKAQGQLNSDGLHSSSNGPQPNSNVVGTRL